MSVGGVDRDHQFYITVRTLEEEASTFALEKANSCPLPKYPHAKAIRICAQIERDFNSKLKDKFESDNYFSLILNLTLSERAPKIFFKIQNAVENILRSRLKESSTLD